LFYGSDGENDDGYWSSSSIKSDNDRDHIKIHDSSCYGSGRHSQSHKGDRRCFYCNQIGHIMNRCPKVKCFNCGDKGHMSLACDYHSLYEKRENREVVRFIDESSDDSSNESHSRRCDNKVVTKKQVRFLLESDNPFG
jgi:hypothetical protein